MENQQKQREGKELVGDENYNNGGVISDDQIDGSDADTDESLDTSVSPDENGDENDSSGVGSQSPDLADLDESGEGDNSELDKDESTGGTAI
jgi:hypothetical protein